MHKPLWIALLTFSLSIFELIQILHIVCQISLIIIICYPYWYLSFFHDFISFPVPHTVDIWVCSWALLICFLFSYPLHLNGTHSIPNELHRRGVNVNFSRFTFMNRMCEQRLISLWKRVAWIIHSEHSAELGKENSIIQEGGLLCFKH